MTVRLVVSIETQPGRGDEQRAAFRQLAPLVRAETGCLQYDLFAVRGDPDRFVLLELWATRDDLQAHGVAPHVVEAARAAASFRAGPARLDELEPTEREDLAR